MQRRKFITRTILGAGAVTLMPSVLMAGSKEKATLRPPMSKRLFVSKAVEEELKKVKKDIADPEIAWLFENCYPNTLDTTVYYNEENGTPDSFIITGDIDAMWLRDSTAQIWPYLPLVGTDPKLENLFLGLINRQMRCILIDPYANAFNKNKEGSYWKTDLTDMKPELHERKWEIDSLCYPIRLSYHYWKKTNDTKAFDVQWFKAAKAIVKTFKDQQRKLNRGAYTFQRISEKPTDTMAGGGYGNPVNPVGLICSAFRPSDDATTLLFLVPSNLFAVTSLRQIAQISEQVYGDKEFASECNSLALEVEQAIQKYAIFNHPKHGNIYAFEVDGYGNRLYMDDSNIPSLLSLPYLGGVDRTDEVYCNTRDFVLSDDNPWFFRGKAAEGIGGPHVGVEMIWPMSIIMRALTSNNDEEIVQCLLWLKNTHAGTGFMHETFHMDDPKNFTRSWFAWVNTLFGELVIKIHSERKYLLKQVF
ncbi:glycoside hydrolase family 125 protein [Labilibaculum antarcticum]|uniref:Tat pathway signal protein n=1 Tax=Labilibaculum antarcticum TaxID=1717717 RepID=A0A1Y1CI63_9BACT|nr:glycoside hydrolase family 125 protein [Labilibaculum antarcticum]BAX79980.1 Tat pathway signal protein [Labilibaculum antarcticum]